jgi:magnesium transporter
MNTETELLSPPELREAWQVLSQDERVEGFRLLPPGSPDDFFLSLSAHEQGDLLRSLPPAERRTWLRLLPPDDAADVIQAVEPEQLRAELLTQLDAHTRGEVLALLAYAEDDAGGLMSPRFARVRPDMSIDEALRYLRKQARTRLETLSYAYALDAQQRLLGVVSIRELFQAAPDKQVHEVMNSSDLITVPERMDQEAVSRLFSESDLIALPVVDEEGRMKGIVTVDDIVDVVQEEATEDIQKAGGMEALEAPYFETSLLSLVRKRAGWLALLFFGGLLTTNAMSHFADEINRAVVLALFAPLIISSGGNSGSQASTLIIRAMTLGEVRMRDWWRVMRRELASGLALGAILMALGFLRVGLGEAFFGAYGESWLPVAFTVAVSLMGVVIWGTLSGSMLPFLLRRLKLDPASASAPAVATLVDVVGLLIYFSVASVALRGTLL